MGIGQDITGRIAQEREYSKLIDSANAPIFGVDTLGRVNVWNQCARKLVGYNTDEGKRLLFFGLFIFLQNSIGGRCMPYDFSKCY